MKTSSKTTMRLGRERMKEEEEEEKVQKEESRLITRFILARFMVLKK